MDFLLAEVERKRKQLETNEVTANKKYFKRGDLATQQAENYRKRQEEKLKKKGLLSGEEKGEGSQDEFGKLLEESRKQLDGEKKDKKISPEEVVRRLRERGEPIKLFGETEEEAAQRLKYVEMMRKDDEKGLRNDFKAAMDKLDQSYLDELVKQEGNEKSKQARDIKLKDDGTTLDDILSMAQNLGKGDKSVNCEVIFKYLKHIQLLWGKDLNDRSHEKKISLEGKLESARFEQTSSYLKPLFRKLKQQTIQDDILEFLTQIVGHALERNYVKASDAYLQMAIGNAPWPIGVTMVGIHARTGREKIFAQHVAHVLNDETQRKYIQGLKRLMTYCQKLFPADPSKSLEYHGVHI